MINFLGKDVVRIFHVEIQLMKTGSLDDHQIHALAKQGILISQVHPQ